MRGVVVCVLLSGLIEIHAQPEVRIYADVFEKVGLSAGYTARRTRFELSGSFWPKQVPANNYVSQTVGWPSQAVAELALATFNDNTWTENTTTITARLIRTGKRQREWFGLYYGLYLRALMINATPDKSNWSASDQSFDATYKLPESSKSVDLFGGLLIGARGKIKGKIFWDATVGLKLIPWFYTSSTLSYNDGSDEHEAYQMAGYQYGAPGDNIVQLGIGYRWGRAE